jgi:hypothetical protein
LIAGICPDNGIVERFSGFLVPKYGGFSLIGDTNRFDAVNRMALFLESFDGSFNALFDRLNNLEWVMFMPSDSYQKDGNSSHSHLRLTQAEDRFA